MIKIGNKIIGEEKPCFIIAEAGVNHNGDLRLAKKLVDAAKAADADTVKFQTYKTEALVTKSAAQAEYQRKNAPAKSQYEMLKKLELSEEQFKEIFYYCKKKKVLFLSTPFDCESAKFLYELGVPAFKISSGDLTNIPFLKYIARFKKPVIISTGMATLKEVSEAVKAVYTAGNRKLILLHCTSNYPARVEDVNLKAIDTLRKEFNVPVGYSDHTEGTEIAVAAVASGALVIEKHFTLSRKMEGPDHRASVEPEIFRYMVQAIRNVESSLGTGIKQPAASEERIKKIVRKSVVSAVDIPKGAILNREMLTIKRPGTGIEPKFMKKLVGKKTVKAIKKDEVIKWSKITL